MNVRQPPVPLLLAAALLLLAVPHRAWGRGQEQAPPPRPEMAWTPWLSDFPRADLTGTWVFDPEHSDPMVEVWQDREVLYVVTQQVDRIVLEFRPADGQPNVQAYRWDGSINAFARDTAEVRERARWTDNGRTLEVDGRWWPFDDTGAVMKYGFLYRMQGLDILEFVQRDEFGETVWRFRRRT